MEDLKVIIFGASGMVGMAALQASLVDEGVKSVLVVGRKPCGVTHAKIRELLLPDLFKLDSVQEQFKGFNACIFTVGASALGRNEAEYARINYDLPVAVARLLAGLNPEMAFCYVSGTGTDSTEKGRVMWARVKGRTENELLRLPFKTAVMFRLAVLIPAKGFKSSTRLYQWLYLLTGWLLPLIARIFPDWTVSSEGMGRAMLRAARGEAPKNILESKDVRTLAGS